MSAKLDFVIRFVSTPGSRKEQMQNAVKGVQAAKVPTERIKEEAVLKMSQRDNNLYVCDPFEGPAFEHLVKLGCRVVGAQCVVSCLEMDISLPRVPHPVHNMSLYGAIITCSSMAKKLRERVQKLVQWMGGTFSKDLTECVTHLIAGEVGSKKYHVAADLKKPIVLPTWIDDLWEASQEKYIKGTSDELVNEYKCPIFKGCNVCVTGFQMDEKKKIMKAITENGGIYSKELKFKESTHLIVGGTKGPKYEYAKKWKMNCVSIQWLFDGVERGYSCDESLYPPESEGPPRERQTSTPVKDSRISDFKGADVSLISNFSTINETAMTTFNTTGIRGQGSDSLITLEGSLRALEELKLDQAHSEPFLDGCKIFLSDLTSDLVEKVRRVINAGGGTRLSQLSDAVTHVLIGERATPTVRHFHAKSPEVYILNVMWLVDSYCRGQRQREDRYTLPEFAKEDTVLAEGKKLNTKAPPVSKKLFTSDDKPDALLSQYLPDSELGEGNAAMLEGTTYPEENGDQDEDETIMEVDGKDGIFQKKIFTVLGFNPEDTEKIQNSIMDANGKIVTESSRSIPDFAVVPLEGCEVQRTVGEVVTVCWLEMSLEAEKFLPTSSNYLFKPVILKQGVEPLSECVISFSQYTASEKEHLRQLAFNLGATCQDVFQRKPTKKIKGNTHLVIEEPQGSKYEASKRWEIPAVTKQWIFQCAKEGTCLPEDKFLVDLPESPPEVTDDPAVFQKEPSPEFPLVTSALPVNDASSDKIPETNSTPKHTPHREETFKTPSLANLNLNSAKRPCSNSSEKSATKIRRGDTGRINPDGTPPVTPGTFLKQTRNLVPKFNFDTPLSERPHRRKSSLPYEVCLYENLSVAVENTGKVVGIDDSRIIKGGQQSDILRGLAIYVSEGLGQRRGELNKLVQVLGGDLRWNFDNACTHFVFQGKSNSTNKEFRKARKADVHIVSPEWLMACHEAERKMDEKLYPHTLNPNMSLSLSQVQMNDASPATRKTSRTLTTPVPVPPPDLEGEFEDDHDLSMEEEQLMIAEAEAVEDKENSGNSQEQREEFQRQFAQIMSASGGNHDSGRRRSRRQAASVGGFSDERNAAVKENRRSSRRSTRLRSNVEHEQMGKDKTIENDSERIMITWDDASSRVCRENALARLREEDTQETEGDKQNEDQRKAEIKEITEQGNFNTSVETEESPSATKTPPPIRLPNANPAVAPEPCDPDTTQLDPPVRRVFLFTGLSDQERINYGALIEQLGGEVLEKTYYTHSCTHMIVGTPTKNEKYLSAVAAGKWILHRSYMVECQKEGRFVEEEPHELNSSMFPENMSKIFPLCNAPRRWREKFENEESDHQGAFDGWKVLLVVEEAKEKGLKRILEAGGGVVLSTRPPFNASQASHLLISNSKAKATKELIDYEELISNGVLCLRPEYLADFLIKDPSPDPSAYITPDIRAILEKLMESTTMSANRTSSSSRTPQKCSARDSLASDTSSKRTRRK